MINYKTVMVNKNSSSFCYLVVFISTVLFCKLLRATCFTCYSCYE